MSDREALLEAIRAKPEDDDLRLGCADWLEEYGDADDQEQAAALRGADLSYAQEQRLLGPPLNDGSWKHSSVFRAEFRRGMVERLIIPTEGFLEMAASLVERFPAFHRLVLTDPDGRGGELADCPSLAAASDLTLADPLPPDDVLALASSPHLDGLRKLRIWCWGDLLHANDCLRLASLPALEEVELLQVNCGLGEGDRAGERDRMMDEIAGRYARETSTLVRVVRPYAKRIPLDGHIRRDLFAGYTRDGRPTLVLGDRTARLLFFDEDGRLVGEEECDFDSVLVRPPEYPWQRYNEQELLEHLWERYGFEFGRIHVREISRDDLTIGIRWMNEPSDVLYWHEGDNFEIDRGCGSGWAGPDGKVHTT